MIKHTFPFNSEENETRMYYWKYGAFNISASLIYLGMISVGLSFFLWRTTQHITHNCVCTTILHVLEPPTDDLWLPRPRLWRAVFACTLWRVDDDVEIWMTLVKWALRALFFFWNDLCTKSCVDMVKICSYSSLLYMSLRSKKKKKKKKFK